jgi:hypothetical protein
MNAQYMECSSKLGRGVEEVFNMAIDLAVGIPTNKAMAKLPGFKRQKKRKSCKIL